jgi:hypothetical protein
MMYAHIAPTEFALCATQMTNSILRVQLRLAAFKSFSVRERLRNDWAVAGSIYFIYIKNTRKVWTGAPDLKILFSERSFFQTSDF